MPLDRDDPVNDVSPRANNLKDPSEVDFFVKEDWDLCEIPPSGVMLILSSFHVFFRQSHRRIVCRA